ncbi:hypothetical protein CSB45_15120 [candidate division KSB3 bacterium]|uniref:Uncharacterized protein n=1 Tax=candidate division KSB3 bacterium TaxID=2044937 RepID=A0A2G6E0I6_9BACT|nr:MAG: hypothetical protein CSB45_15120 [candidate division KSB3 bacterium]PIE28329.1 MAG: hypothetical protein CSA57_14415 [candidate division KSB3 bacterium]
MMNEDEGFSEKAAGCSHTHYCPEMDEAAFVNENVYTSCLLTASFFENSLDMVEEILYISAL